MRFPRFPRMVMMILALLLSLPAMAATSAARQDAGTTEVTVHVNLCVAAGCNEVLEAIEPADGVEVTLSTVDDGTVLGTCVTGDPNPGTCVIALEQVPEMVTVSIDPATVPEGYTADGGAAPYQLMPETPEVWLLLYPADGDLGLPPVQEEIPPTPEPTVAPGDDSPVPLPEPLALELPTWLYGGTCADLEAMAGSTFSEELNGVAIVEGEHRGSPKALVAASSYSEVAVPFGALLEGDYAISVTDDQQELIACGEIGGPVGQTGTLAIGLAPANNSGATGVAYIAAQGEERIGISVFLAPGEPVVATPVP